MATIKDNAICLRMLDWSETSQIVVLFTHRHGRISATAKGAKRQTPSTLAKFSGGVELLTTGEAVLIIKQNTELANLIEWDMTDAHWHLRSDFNAYRSAMYAADLVHHLITDHDPHPNIFTTLISFLRQLAEHDQQLSLLLRFQWSLISDLGYRPVLDRDAQTGEVLDHNAHTLAFSPTAGGVVTNNGNGDRWRVHGQTIRLLRDVAMNKPLDNASPDSLKRANRLMCAYFRSILDKQLPTMDFLLAADTPLR